MANPPDIPAKSRNLEPRDFDGCPEPAAGDRAEVGRARPFPVNVVTPEGRLSVPKVRAFVHFAVPRLRIKFARLAADAGF